MRKRLAIITTHPIQYNIPLFRLLTERGLIDVMVFYTWGRSALEEKYDPGFGKVIKWDIPLLEGYSSEFLENKAKQPGSHHFRGIDNPDIIRSIDAWQPDALLMYGWSFKSHLKVMRHYKHKIPVFFRGDSTLLNDKPGLKSFIRRIFLRWVYSHTDIAFYVGKNNKDYFENAGLMEHQLILAPHAVDNDFFLDKDGSYGNRARQWRHELGIAEEDKVFLFAGKLEQNKLPFTLLEVFNRGNLPKEAHLIVVGNGVLEAGLKAAAKNDHIHFLDFQNQKMMPVVYRLGDVFVLPSGSETWGLAINEAMLCGLPVIASSRCGGAVDLIKDGYNGYIFKAGNAGDLQEKILLMMENKETIGKMRENAGDHIRRFSVTRVAEEIEKAVHTNK